MFIKTFFLVQMFIKTLILCLYIIFILVAHLKFFSDFVIVIIDQCESPNSMQGALSSSLNLVKFSSFFSIVTCQSHTQYSIFFIMLISFSLSCLMV